MTIYSRYFAYAVDLWCCILTDWSDDISSEGQFTVTVTVTRSQDILVISVTHLTVVISVEPLQLLLTNTWTQSYFENYSREGNAVFRSGLHSYTVAFCNIYITIELVYKFKTKKIRCGCLAMHLKCLHK